MMCHIWQMNKNRYLSILFSFLAFTFFYIYIYLSHSSAFPFILWRDRWFVLTRQAAASYKAFTKCSPIACTLKRDFLWAYYLSTPFLLLSFLLSDTIVFPPRLHFHTDVFIFRNFLFPKRNWRGLSSTNIGPRLWPSRNTPNQVRRAQMPLLQCTIFLFVFCINFFLILFSFSFTDFCSPPSFLFLLLPNGIVNKITQIYLQLSCNKDNVCDDGKNKKNPSLFFIF